ncbi:MAG: class I SAM-dependent methyltransferase [Woeseiaceae bacterium]
MKKIIVPLLMSLAAISCSQPESDPATVATTAPDVEVDVFVAALENPARPESDRGRDAGRQPAAVLEFFGIAPGMAVLDMFSGGGYYTEIIAGVVGPEGRVVAHSNKAYLQFVGEEFEARHADGRLPNVDVLMAENNELELDENQFDAVMMVLSYHDTYWVAPDRGWPEFDRPKLLAELYAAMKPGGVMAVIDHQAEPGSPGESGGQVHRIDRAIVVADFEQAGFVLEDESDLLRNPEDDYSKGVFDPAVNGKTDRFMLKFRKAE